jgi:hypothetical protein
MKASEAAKTRARERVEQVALDHARGARERAEDDGLSYAETCCAGQQAAGAFMRDHVTECDRCGVLMLKADASPDLLDEYGEHECADCYDRRHEPPDEVDPTPTTIGELMDRAYAERGTR